MQQIMMFKNLGLAGGFLALAAAGAGAWSVDAKRAAA
jgi:putative oxidoreductase